VRIPPVKVRGPGGATQVANYYAFEQTFGFSDWGYGSAVATLMVAGVVTLSVVVNRAGGETV
jgi:multiple sugar transport system permease protein